MLSKTELAGATPSTLCTSSWAAAEITFPCRLCSAALTAGLRLLPSQAVHRPKHRTLRPRFPVSCPAASPPAAPAAPLPACAAPGIRRRPGKLLRRVREGCERRLKALQQARGRRGRRSGPDLLRCFCGKLAGSRTGCWDRSIRRCRRPISGIAAPAACIPATAAGPAAPVTAATPCK